MFFRNIDDCTCIEQEMEKSKFFKMKHYAGYTVRCLEKFYFKVA